MHWQKIALSSGRVADGEHMKIQSQFEKLFIALAGPKEMALFGSRMAVNDREFVTMYFSPKCFPNASGLTTPYSAVECSAPSEEDVALLVGHTDAWSLLA